MAAIVEDVILAEEKEETKKVSRKKKDMGVDEPVELSAEEKKAMKDVVKKHFQKKEEEKAKKAEDAKKEAKEKSGTDVEIKEDERKNVVSSPTDLYKFCKLALDTKKTVFIPFNGCNIEKRIFKYIAAPWHAEIAIDDYFKGQYLPEDENRLKQLVNNSFGEPVECFVTGIDEVHGLIKCQRASERAKVSQGLKNTIEEAIASGKQLKLRAKIVYVVGQGRGGTQFAIVRIESTSVRGVIWPHDWSDGYIPDLSMVARVGDEIEVVPVNTDVGGVEADFKCSRLLALPENRWECVSDLLSKGDVVSVRILGPRYEFFVGRIEGLPDIPIYVYRAKNTKMEILRKGVYQCIISKIDLAKRNIDAIAYLPVRDMNDGKDIT